MTADTAKPDPSIAAADLSNDDRYKRLAFFLGTGPETKVREQRTRVSLGPFVALAALLPLSFVLLRRNL